MAHHYKLDRGLSSRTPENSGTVSDSVRRAVTSVHDPAPNRKAGGDARGDSSEPCLSRSTLKRSIRKLAASQETTAYETAVSDEVVSSPPPLTTTTPEPSSMPASLPLGA